jgi:hypothetical protein
MTLQELLDKREVERRRIVHFEHPEISAENFAAEVQLEWTEEDGSLYRIDDHEHEHL